MSAVTVRTMLAIILENGLQMDDEIHFVLSPETDDNKHQINFIKTESWEITGKKTKHIDLIFDLDVIY